MTYRTRGLISSTAQGKSLNDLVRHALEHVVEYT